MFYVKRRKSEEGDGLVVIHFVIVLGGTELPAGDDAGGYAENDFLVFLTVDGVSSFGSGFADEHQVVRSLVAAVSGFGEVDFLKVGDFASYLDATGYDVREDAVFGGPGIEVEEFVVVRLDVEFTSGRTETVLGGGTDAGIVVDVGVAPLLGGVAEEFDDGRLGGLVEFLDIRLGGHGHGGRDEEGDETEESFHISCIL